MPAHFDTIPEQTIAYLVLLYFADKDRKRALLTDYLGHDNMLIFAFGHLNR